MRVISEGGKSWFTAAELAELRLPGLPKAKRKINERAAAERWALKTDAAGRPLARPRQARGGGLEYHLQALPPAARIELLRRGMAGEAAISAAPTPARPNLWAWYDGQSETVKTEAARRAEVLAAVEEMERSGLTRTSAVACAAARFETGASTIWSWLSLIAGVEPAERLPHLAPRRTGGGAEAEIDDDAWKILISDYLRPEKPTWASCYRRMVDDYAAPRGIEVPSSRTLWRKLNREVDGRLIVARREGAEGLRRTLPPQQRSVAGLQALELVNIDGHKLDVFVRFPNGRIGRPVMVAIQDIYSRKILAWRVGETESAVLTRLAFADLFSKVGIPGGCVLDNGRAFASKWITGGAKSRFRFKVREEEPTGLLTSLSVQIHWAMPYRGQSKPIERAFRDLCGTIAKHPALAGAYTGNSPEAKPDNYGQRAVELELLRRITAAGIAAHNARPGRRTETARGRSFDETFAESYAIAPIRKATPEELRLALLTADEVSTDRRTGAISLFGNRYWTGELSAVAGRKVTVRFDPDDLSAPIHVYDRATGFLASAPVLQQTGFLDVESAKARARQEAELRKTVKRLGELEQLLSPEQLAAQLPAYSDEAELPPPSVVRPVRHRGTAAALKPQLSAASEPVQFKTMDRLAQAAESRRLRLVQD